MRFVEISNTNLHAIVDDEDYGRVDIYPWSLAGSTREAITTKLPNGRYVRLWDLILNDFVNLYDHKDRNFLNNRRENLRKCTHGQNMMNRGKFFLLRASSEFKGVSRASNTTNKIWKASIKYGKKNIHLGYFTHEIQAAKAYDEAARKYHGEFARLNFIKED